MKTKLILLLIIVFYSATNAQKWTNYTTANGLSDNDIRAIAIDVKGNKWLATGRGGVLKFDGINWTHYLDSTFVDAIAIDAQGNKWFGTVNGGVLKFDDTNWTAFTKANGLTSNGILSIAIDAQNNKWFGCSPIIQGNILVGGGVSKFDDTKWTHYLGTDKVQAITRDSSGNVWFGTKEEGAAKFDGYNWTYYYMSTNGIASNDVRAIAIDVQGNKWFGTLSWGVSKFDGTNWTTYNTSNGLAHNWVYSIAFDAQGNKWFGTYNGLSKFDGTNWTTYTVTDGLADNTVWAIAIDAQGNKWVGTHNGLSKFEDGSTGLPNTKNGNSNKLFIYTNPAVNEITLSFPYSGNYTLIVRNIAGKIVKQLTGLSGEKTLLQNENLEPGIYFLSLKSLSNGTIYNGKIIIER